MADRSLFELKSTPGTAPFTWRRGNCFSRLDYVFVNSLLGAHVRSNRIAWYEFGSNFDHACVEATFVSGKSSTRGRSFPKLFKTDIASDLDRDWVKKHIEDTVAQFPGHWDPHMRLEYLKVVIRTKVLELRKMRISSSSSQSIKDRINSLISSNCSQSDIDLIESLKVELAKAESVEAEAMRIRAGAKWVEEGEKSTRYFLGRFKARMAAGPPIDPK